MAGSNAKIGKGIELRVGDGAASESFTKFAELKSLTPPTKTREMPDVTNSDSPGGYKQFIAGLKDGGEVAGDMNFVDDTAVDATDADFEAGTLRNYQIVFPNGRLLAFAALVSSIGPAQVSQPSPMMFNVKLKVDGGWSIA